MARTIYTDFETEEAIKTITNLSPEFNLSAFVKDKLLEQAVKQASIKNNISYLQERKKLLINQKKEIELQISRFDILIEDASKNKEKQLMTEQEKLEQEKKKKQERIKSFSDSIKTFFKISDKKLIKELAEEFNENRSKFETLFEFMNSKGYKENPNQVLKEKIKEKPA